MPLLLSVANPIVHPVLIEFIGGRVTINEPAGDNSSTASALFRHELDGLVKPSESTAPLARSSSETAAFVASPTVLVMCVAGEDSRLRP